MKLKRYLSYRHFLTSELELRQQKNPQYTVTDFCRELNMRHSRLTEILSGKMGVSEERAQQIADRLGLPEEEKQIFVDLVQSLHGRGALVKKIAMDRLQQRFKNLGEASVSSNAEIADAIHGALWEMAVSRSSQNNDLPSINEDHLTTQKQVLEQAKGALEDRVSAKDFSSLVMRIPKSQLVFLMQSLWHFHQSLKSEIDESSSDSEDLYYRFSLQVFELPKKI